MGGGGLSPARLARMRDVMAGHIERGAVPGFPPFNPVYLDFWTSAYQAIDD